MDSEYYIARDTLQGISQIDIAPRDVDNSIFPHSIFFTPQILKYCVFLCTNLKNVQNI